MTKNNPMKSVRSSIWYGVPATGAGKFGALVAEKLWQHVSGVADALNSFGILQLAGLPENVQIDQTWLASICALGGAVWMSFVMSQLKYLWKKYGGVVTR